VSLAVPSYTAHFGLTRLAKLAGLAHLAKLQSFENLAQICYANKIEESTHLSVVHTLKPQR
jgi:hypothetical protein